MVAGIAPGLDTMGSQCLTALGQALTAAPLPTSSLCGLAWNFLASFEVEGYVPNPLLLAGLATAAN